MTYYFGGAPYHPGTNVPSNVTGECPHKHRTPEAAQRCIERRDRSIKAANGPNAYCDRVVMVNSSDPDNWGTRVWDGAGSEGDRS